MSEGYGKITVNGDELLKKHAIWTTGEGSDASNSGTRRQAIGAYAEKCGIDGKALSQFRAGLKIKNDGKRKDWLRSLQLLMPVAEKEIFANEPALGLDNPNEDEQAKAADAAANEGNAIAEDHGAGNPDEDVSDATTERENEEQDPELAQDAEDFDQAAAVGGDNVVTPIDFGGGAVA
ncbi:MAG: hypothetical protein JKX76_00135 [Colwellia sp.]|nr:hypothetical protein [Colwellia sp.]